MTYDEATAALESLIDFEKLGATYFGRDRFQLANVRRLLQEGLRPPAGNGISVLGPIPMPLKLGELEVEVDWYACVRRTELGKIEEIADELRAQHGQASFATLASAIRQTGRIRWCVCIQVA